MKIEHNHWRGCLGGIKCPYDSPRGAGKKKRLKSGYNRAVRRKTKIEVGDAQNT